MIQQNNLMMVIKSQQSREISTVFNPSFHFSLRNDDLFPSEELRKAFYAEFGKEITSVAELQKYTIDTPPKELHPMTREMRKWIEENSSQYNIRFDLYVTNHPVAGVFTQQQWMPVIPPSGPMIPVNPMIFPNNNINIIGAFTSFKTITKMINLINEEIVTQLRTEQTLFVNIDLPTLEAQMNEEE